MAELSEADRLSIIDDLIARYLAHTIDRRTLTEWEALHHLSGEWIDDPASALSR